MKEIESILATSIKNANKEDIAWKIGEIVAMILFALATVGVGMAAQSGKLAAKAAKFEKLIEKWGLNPTDAKRVLDKIAKIFEKLENKAPVKGLGWQNPMFRHALQSYNGGAASNAARALTKHPNIVGVNAAPDRVMKALIDKFGSQAGINQAAADALKNIMRNGTATTKTTKAFGDVVDFVLPNGLGARFNAVTNEFIGFLGRGL